MKLRKSRQHRRGRIEIIPMIDVMFFLLVTFMLASLSMQNLHSLAVNLPQGHAAPLQAKTPVTLTPDSKGLKCATCHRVYPIQDDIPVMLPDEARVEAG